MALSVCSMYVNFYGWTLWVSFADPIGYNNLQIAIYSLFLIGLFWWGRYDRECLHDSLLSRLFASDYPRRILLEEVHEGPTN